MDKLELGSFIAVMALSVKLLIMVPIWLLIACYHLCHGIVIVYEKRRNNDKDRDL